MGYDLNGLGPDAFEELVQGLLKKIIGSETITFGHGPDGCRDAKLRSIPIYSRWE
jgi:hypothetical protein